MKETVILLTDVVDSTQLTSELGDARMAAIWQEHDRLARDALRAHQGREVDRTDGFLVVFDSAEDGVAFAEAYHDGLEQMSVRHEVSLRARCGLHFAEVILIETPAEDVARGAKPLEMEGLAKPLAARVMSLATGGQTLITAEVANKLETREDRAVVSHGHWSLKGVQAPVEVFEVEHAHAPMMPPPDASKVYRVVQRAGLWTPATEIPHALPGIRDAFVGRNHELQGLAERLGSDARLASLVGIGGSGKTRLATRYARMWLAEWPGGVWFCDLSDARNLEDVLAAVAQVLEINLDDSSDVAAVGKVLAGRERCLLILDNFEQVARHAQAILAPWLESAPRASFLVTTREVLGLRGEQVLPVAPLSAIDAAVLFETRVRATLPSYSHTAHAGDVVELVELLDCLPLAIELAAARVRVLSPRQIIERLADRFRLLTSTGVRRDRQATLRGTLDWSWDLLQPWEQSALAQLSVFEGGLDLEAVEQIVELEAWPDAPWTLDVIQNLVDRSLVARADEHRFDLLVSVKAYSHEKLEQLGSAAGARERHWRYYASFGEAEALDRLRGPEGPELWRARALDRDNGVAGFHRATRAKDGASAASCLRAVAGVVGRSGPHSLLRDLARIGLGVLEPGSHDAVTTRQILARALLDLGEVAAARKVIDEAAPEEPGDRARIQLATGLASYAAGELQVGLRAIGEAERFFREAEDTHHLAEALRGRGNLLALADRQRECLAAYLEARELFEARGDLQAAGHLDNNVAIAFAETNDLDAATASFERAAERMRETGDSHRAITVLQNLGYLHELRGDPLRAIEVLEEADALAMHRGFFAERLSIAISMTFCHGNLGQNEAVIAIALPLIEQLRGDATPTLCNLLNNLGDALRALGRWEEAQAALEEALEMSQHLDLEIGQAPILFDLGLLHRDRGETEAALQRLREGQAQLTTHSAQTRFRGRVTAVELLLDLGEEAGPEVEALVEELADADGSSPHELRARAVLGRALALRDPDRSRALLEEVDASLEASNWPTTSVAHASLAWARSTSE